MKVHKFQVFKCWVFSFLRYEDFYCSLDVLYEGQGISKIVIFYQKI
jgi:hypothetical protein